MYKIHIVLLIIVLALFPTACAGNVVAQNNKIEPASIPVKVEPTEIPETPTLEVVSKDSPANCPVTVTGILSFEAPEPYSPAAPWEGHFWFGSEHLWTVLPENGIWSALPKNRAGYTQKIFWWSDLFSLPEEPQPDIVVTGERLDGKAPPLKTYGGTNASAGDIGDAMLTGVDFPTLGCWKITGEYKETSLIFYVWVAP